MQSITTQSLNYRTDFVVEADKLDDDRHVCARILDRDDSHDVGSVLRVRVYGVGVRHYQTRVRLQQLYTTATPSLEVAPTALATFQPAALFLRPTIHRVK